MYGEPVMVFNWENVTEQEILKDERLWVPCDSDALDRLCEANLSKDWLAKKEEK